MTIIRNSWRYRIFFFIILEIKESFHKIDLNGDGRLSRRELMKAAAILGNEPDGQGHRRHDERRGQK